MTELLDLQRGAVSARYAIALLVIAALLIAGCAAGDEAVSDGEMKLTFDGESCTYEGPARLKAGPATLVFLNESDETAVANLVRHTGDETYEDIVEYTGEEPSSKHAPPWTVDVVGVYKFVKAGESHTWEGDLEPGIHTIVCATAQPLGVYIGAGLTVEE